MHIEPGWIFFSLAHIAGLVLVYGLLRWHLEVVMTRKLDEHAKTADQKFAPKDAVDGMREDVKKMLGLFERLDAKLDQFLAMKPKQ